MSPSPSPTPASDNGSSPSTSNRIIGTGEMAALIRAHDWTSTPLGPIDSWSKELLTIVNLTLSSSSPARTMWGPDFILIYNDAYRPFPGPRHPSALGRPAKEVYRESWHVVGPLLENAFATGETFFYEKLLVPLPSQGGIRDSYLNYSFNPIFEDGKIAGLFGPLHDVTGEVTATRKLRESEARATRILQSIGDAVIVTDADARITRMNPIAESLTGWLLDDARGHLLPEVFRITSETTREPVESPAEKVKRLGTIVGLANHTILTAKDGTETHIDDSGAPIRDDNGDLTGIVLVFRDINDRRRAERNLELLSDSGRALAQSLDFETTLRNIAQVAIRTFSDFCYFDILQPDGTIKRTVQLHRDPTQQPILDEASQIQLTPNPRHPVNQALATGEPVLIEHVTDEWRQSIAINPTHLRYLRELGYHTLLTVPILSGSETFGTLSFCRTVDSAAFTPDDRSTATELSNRIGAALVNARLYRSVQEAQSLARSERERLRDLFMQAPAPILTMDGPNHVITLANQGYVRLLRRKSESDLIGKTLREVLPELEGQGFFELLDNVHRTGTPYIGNEMMAHLENTITGELDEGYFNFVYQPARNAAGEVDGILVFATEVTEQVRSRKQSEIRERLLERQTSELETIYKTAPIGLALFDPVDFRYLRLNDTQAQIVGLPASEIIGKTLTEIAPIEGLNEMFQQVVDGKPIENALLEGVLPTQPDVHRSWTVNYFPVYGEDGKVQAITAASLEITAQRRAEEALIQNEKIAAVGRLASSIAHEINNPLESVTNLLYIARNSEDIGEIQHYLEIADRELRRISLIASQTLRFYRQSTRPQAIQCKALIESVLTLYQGRLLNSSIQVETREWVKDPIVCFEGEIRQVLNNLVGNALDAMPHGGRLLIRSRVSTNWTKGEKGITLTFADTGCGIKGDLQKRIFEPFFTTKGMNGTGLGLWISKDIIEKHFGSLRVRSSQQPGKSGTVFTLFLPFQSTLHDPPTPKPIS